MVVRVFVYLFIWLLRSASGFPQWLHWKQHEEMKAAACHGVFAESHWVYLLSSPPLSYMLAPKQLLCLPIAAAQTTEGDYLAHTVPS